MLRGIRGVERLRNAITSDHAGFMRGLAGLCEQKHGQVED